MLALFFDLEHRWYVWRMYMTFRVGSPMSWGSWILLLVYPVLIANMMIDPPAFLAKRIPLVPQLSGRLNASAQALRMLGGLSILLGVALGIYTGILLSAFGARPLWNSAILGPLFLASGLSSASALVHMTAPDPEEKVLLAKADNMFLGAELVILLLFLIGLASSTQVHVDSARLLMSGSFAPLFWVFVVGIGIVLPLFVQTLAVRHRISHTPVAPILVLAGGLALRFVIVYAGQASHWTRLMLVK
jgi:formate-dependent nitrite reductase membrane component NrfD